MAPIPEDQDKAPNDDEVDFSTHSHLNFNTTFPQDSSDEDDDQFPENGGYVLLPQEPDDGAVGEEEDNEILMSLPETGSQINNIQEIDEPSVPDFRISDNLPDEVIRAEGGVSVPTAALSSSKCSLHPDFLVKFPDGKVPSYMQVPDVQTNRKDVLWNKKRIEQDNLDSAQESKIIRAMASFSLPSENVPDWAKQMSDDQWSTVIANQLILSQNQSDTHLNHKQQSSHTSDENAVNQDNWVAEFPDS